MWRGRQYGGVEEGRGEGGGRSRGRAAASCSTAPLRSSSSCTIRQETCGV